jgi:hypothetical protein
MTTKTMVTPVNATSGARTALRIAATRGPSVESYGEDGGGSQQEGSGYERQVTGGEGIDRPSVYHEQPRNEEESRERIRETVRVQYSRRCVLRLGCQSVSSLSAVRLSEP